MRRHRYRLLVIAALTLLSAASPAHAQVEVGRVRGQIRDGSDAAIPGANIEAFVAGRLVAVVVTDSRGEFDLPGIPLGRVFLRMALDGFQTSTVDVPVSPGAETIVAEVLRVAPVTEAVVVRAAAPPPPAPSPPPPPPEPPYQVRPISRLDLALVCGPAKPPRAWAPVGTLAGHPRDASRILFRTGDEVTLDATPGTVLEVGQNLVARRVFPLDRPSAGNALGEYTAGVIQVSSVRAAGTTAVIMHACGELQKGDLLVPFPVEPLLIADPIGTPVFEDAARILFGEPGHMMGAPGRMLVIDRGRLHGIRQGQRLTIFRSSRGQRTVVGRALVLVVREDSARILVESATDAVWFGDMAAPQRPWRQTGSGR